ncbi:hypothetical protein JW916_12425 [Candidatus Sumerlaeota bacterium]|nr:hypothetical protein [Candidatus Sumerlaeota bacterium]
METVEDFQDVLALLADHKVRYVIIGGLAFIFHARPRFTKDIDIWIDPAAANVGRANLALREFGSPALLDADRPNEILQIGVAPNRIDVLLTVEGLEFETAWKGRVRERYGDADANWIGLDHLIQIKSLIDNPRHQEDVRVLREVKKRIEKERKRRR